MEYSARVKVKTPARTKSESILLMVGKWVVGAYTSKRVHGRRGTHLRVLHTYMQAQHCTQGSRPGPVGLGLGRFPTTAKHDRGLRPIGAASYATKTCACVPRCRASETGHCIAQASAVLSLLDFGYWGMRRRNTFTKNETLKLHSLDCEEYSYES